MSDVGRYRKVYPRLWRHPGFHTLTNTGRELALYLLTGPQTSRIGVFHFSIATAAEDLNIGAETLRKGLSNVAVAFGWHFDADARVFYIPSWWRWNTPENANVLKGNLKDLNEIPPCGLVDAFARNLETLPETLHQTFVEGCRIRLLEPSPIQEQYQGSESEKQEQEPALRRGGAPRRLCLSLKAQNGEKQEVGKAGMLISIARETLKLTNPRAPIDELVDAFRCTAGHMGKVPTFTKAEAISALNAALSERRAATS